MYHPEMGEKPDLSKLFHSSHNYRDSYCLEWLQERDVEARETLKRLKIRPSAIEKRGAGEYICPFTGPIYTALITGNAHDKLFKAGVTELEALLD